MFFSYDPQNSYYTFYQSKCYADNTLIPDEIPFGSFIIDFLSIDIEELTQILKVNINEHIGSWGWIFDGYDIAKKILYKKYNHRITDLLLDDLRFKRRRQLDENSGVSFFSVVDSTNSTFKSLQYDLSNYIIEGSIDAEGWCAVLEDHQEIGVLIRFDNTSSRIYMTYDVKDLISLLALDFVNIQNKNVHIKQCANCKSFFIPLKRLDEIYCDRIFKDRKTCKQLGYSIKEKNDPFKREFTKARKTQHARIRYNEHIKDYKEKHYLPWLKAAQEAKKKYENDNDIDGFCNWLKDNKNSF